MPYGRISNSAGSTLMASPNSNAGGVSARQGFKFQDHVAAKYLLHMLNDASLIRVECETADDIVLRWSASCPFEVEYIQVKTTEGNSKWSQKELFQRESKRVGSSVAEKSLACDNGNPNCGFRIVTKRDANDTLSPLKRSISARFGDSDYIRLSTSIGKVFKTFKSPNGKNFQDWVSKMIWEHDGEMRDLAQRNLRSLAELSEQFGAVLTTKQQQTVYEEILEKADAAATHDKSEPDKKMITRVSFLDWFSTRISSEVSGRYLVEKPYKEISSKFFVCFHRFADETNRQSYDGLDAQYESQYKRKVWRAKQLSDYVIDFLPEVALRPRELVLSTHLNGRENLRRALRLVRREGRLNTKELLAELLLHVAVRETFKSEPIGGRVLRASVDDQSCLRSAYVVHAASTELWLGTSLLIASGQEDIVDQVIEKISDVLASDFLKDEREIIIDLRQPEHLLPGTLDQALLRHAPIDEFANVLSIAIMVAYDSNALKLGFSDDYKEKLMQEIDSKFRLMSAIISSKLKQVKVHIFFIPVEQADTLIHHFEEKVNAI